MDRSFRRAKPVSPRIGCGSTVPPRAPREAGKRDSAHREHLTVRPQPNNIAGLKYLLRTTFPLAIRTFTILVLVVAMLAGGSLGTSNGMVVCIDSDGHVAVEAPHLSHAFHHAEGADHEPHDYDGDAEHADLHEMIGSCFDSLVSVQRLERSSSSLAAIHHFHVVLNLCLPACSDIGVQPLDGSGLAVATFRGGTAHIELACLRSVVLLV